MDSAWLQHIAIFTVLLVLMFIGLPKLKGLIWKEKVPENIVKMRWFIAVICGVITIFIEKYIFDEGTVVYQVCIIMFIAHVLNNQEDKKDVNSDAQSK